MNQSESIAALASALAGVQLHLEPVAKDKTNPAFKSRYATLDAIMESVRGPLAGSGLCIIQGGDEAVYNTEGHIVGVSVETMLAHASGEWISATFASPLEKHTPQGLGSAVTYLRRYGVSALLGLATEDDDDGNTASKSSARPAKALAPTSKYAGAAGLKMPFGKRKDELLGDIDTVTLTDAVAWIEADTKRKEDFARLSAACTEVVAGRRS